MKAIHFISGLPRSGSTLLAALLSQNPTFHASISSPLAHIVNSAWAAMGPQNEAIDFIGDVERFDILKGIVEQYYCARAAETVFDSSRLWAAKTALLMRLYPDAKMICPVRCVSWILDSIECLIRKDFLSPTRLFNGDTGLNVNARCNALVGGQGMIGMAYNNLREACYGEFSRRVMLIRYESLIADPFAALAAVYNFCDLPGSILPTDSAPGHDFENVAFPPHTAAAIEAFDRRLNAPGLHRVRGKVEKQERDTVLPPDLFQSHLPSDFWHETDFAKTGVTVV